MPQTFSLSDHTKWQDLVVSYVRKSVPRGRGLVALETADTNTGFPAKWCLWNDRRNSILMKCQHQNLGSVYDWLKQFSLVARPIRSTTQTSSVWNFCARSTDVNYRENQCGAANCRLFSQARGLGGRRGYQTSFCLYGVYEKKPVYKGRTWIPLLKVKVLILHLIIVAYFTLLYSDVRQLMN